MHINIFVNLKFTRDSSCLYHMIIKMNRCFSSLVTLKLINICLGSLGYLLIRDKIFANRQKLCKIEVP